LLSSIPVMISLSSLTSFLKVMMREAHEQRTKHREAVGASSSSQTPLAYPKQLTKRRRPSTLCEESSPEDDVSYAALQVHRIVNVALHREYPLGIVFIFSQGRKYLYHV
jgi:hypothetical protein